MSGSDPTRRFSDRVQDYVRYRPAYPSGVLDILARETGLAEALVIADVGSGTGISSRLFLDSGCTVFGVEPNAEMRAAAEAELGTHPRFRSVTGTAEETTLPDAAVDYGVAGQAFHWFDRTRARAELRRILKPGGWVVLMWNSRRLEGSPFLGAYEALLREFGTDYRQVDHKNITPEHLAEFFGGPFESRTLPNSQLLDLEGVRGRLLSSSYVPAAGHPQQAPMLARLGEIFRQHETGGRISFDYDTEIFFGRLAP